MLYWIAVAWLIFGYRMWLHALQPKSGCIAWAYCIAASIVLPLVLVAGPPLYLYAWLTYEPYKRIDHA